MKKGLNSVYLTEDRVLELINLAELHAKKHNLIAELYINALINPDTVGNSDAGQMVENLIRYYKD